MRKKIGNLKTPAKLGREHLLARRAVKKGNKRQSDEKLAQQAAAEGITVMEMRCRQAREYQHIVDAGEARHQAALREAVQKNPGGNWW